MPQPRLSDELALEALEAYYRHGVKSEAARALGLEPGTYRSRLDRAFERGLDLQNPAPPGFIVKRRKEVTDEEGNVKTRTVSMRSDHGGKFVLPDGHIVKGISALVDGNNNVTQQWIKTREDKVFDLVGLVKEELEGMEEKAELVAAPSENYEELVSIYPIADQHHGLMAWGRETGDNYNLEIGSARLRDCSTKLISQSPASDVAVILNLGDYFHADSQEERTPKSKHPLDVDGRYQKVVQTGVRLLRDVIDLALQKHRKVIVRNLPGNHDPHSSVVLTIALDFYYSNEPRVEIDDSPSEWFFYHFGKVLIGAHHGHRSKAETMAMNLAAQRPEEWGLSKHRYFYFGHIHHYTGKEVGPVWVESFQSLASKDAYAAAYGFSNRLAMQSITLHENDGEIGRHKVNVL